MSFTTIAIILLTLFNIAHAINIIVLSNRIDYIDKVVNAFIENKIKIEFEERGKTNE